METEIMDVQEDRVRISKAGWGMVAGVMMLMAIHPVCHAVVRKKVSEDLSSVRRAVVSVCAHSAQGAQLSEPLDGSIYVDQRYVGFMPPLDQLCASPSPDAAIDAAFGWTAQAIESAINTSHNPAPRVFIKRTQGGELRIREVGASLLSRLVGVASLDVWHLITKPWTQANWQDYMPTAQLPVSNPTTRLLAGHRTSRFETVVP